MEKDKMKKSWNDGMGLTETFFVLEKNKIDHDYEVDEFTLNSDGTYFKLILSEDDCQWYYVLAKSRGPDSWEIISVEQVIHVHDGEDCAHKLEILSLSEPN